MRKDRKTLKLIAATSVTLFSLLAVFSACIAWFSRNIETGASGADLNIEANGGHLKYVHFHSFVGGQSTNSSFSFNKTAFTTYQYNWTTNKMVLQSDDVQDVWNMGDYSYISKNHPLLIVFEFDKDYESITVGDMYVRGTTTVGGNSLVTNYAPNDTQRLDPYTTGGGYLGARDANGSPFYSLPQTQVQDANHPESILIRKDARYDYYALSSVTAFRNKAYSNSEYGAITAGDYITIATNTLETDESFTTINNVTDRYYFNQTPYLFKSNGSGSIKYIALVVEYSQDAIGYIYSTYLGDSGLNRYDSILHFACDWSLEVV